MTVLIAGGRSVSYTHLDVYKRQVFIPLAVVNIYRNGIQGMGYGLLPMMAGVAELIGRGVVALIAASRKSYVGACLANPAAWLFAGALLLIMYFSIMKKREKNSLLS